MANEVEVPPMGESITQATLLRWHKNEGDRVAVDEPICELETDKANADLPAPVAGILHPLKKAGETVTVGQVIARIDPTAQAAAKPGAAAAPAPTQPAPAPPAPTQSAPPPLSPAVRALIDEHKLDPAAIPATGPNNRLTKEDVQRYLAQRSPASAPAPAPAPPPQPAVQRNSAQIPPPPPLTPPAAPAPAAQPAPASVEPAPLAFDADGIYRTPMSKIRKRIAERLVAAQQTAAILTTVNEADMTAVQDLRAKYKEHFEKVHGIGLGYMSFFARACVVALRDFPRLNAFIDGDDIVYHQYVHLGIAVSTDRGLAVPVVRNAHLMSFARIEVEVKRLATAARQGKLALEELSGGTFTITNGGIWGSLLSTPILNPPQSGILGMHAIQKRAVVIDDKIVIRPMMYLALSYDHRLVDGREAVTFLVRLKQLLEDPSRLMLEV